MIDLRLLRSDPESVKASIARRGEDVAPLDLVLELDLRQRQLAEERDALRNEVHTISQQVGGLHREGRGDEAASLQDRSRELGEDADSLSEQADALAVEIRDLLLRIPNIPA
ncbi:MAG TPA: serine--tRNA ligase, partial [Acidimicrobiaceae bacterium]|nr:serine--tRNA ligase [Acidimicrobiaceae bacterium]